MTFGNETDARFIRDWYVLMAEHRREYQEQPPSGWSKLGSGCYRAAFLNTMSGLVYKVEHRYGNGYGQSNQGEAETFRRFMLRKLPKGCRLPRWAHYELDGRGVMVMEHFEKLLHDYSMYSEEGAPYWNAQNKFSSSFPDLWDLHGSNIAVDEETRTIVPIDLGA